MKKIIGLIIVLMLVISISSLALAEEAKNNSVGESEYEETNENSENETEDPVDNETENEIRIMNNSLGAEIRLLQLEKAITRNLLKGKMSVDVLEDLGYNTTDLKEILDELELVLDQVKNADPEANESVEVFVGLKLDSINLTKQFRDTLRDIVKGSDYNQLKEQIKKNATNLENYSKKIRNRIKQFNKNQMYRLYGMIGEKNNSCVNQYMNDTMNLTQVKLQLNKMVNMKAKEKKQEVFSHMKKEMIQNKAFGSALANKVKANFTERKQELLQERFEKANETDNEGLMEKIQEKIQENQKNMGNPGQGNSASDYGNGKENSGGKGKGK